MGRMTATAAEPRAGLGIAFGSTEEMHCNDSPLLACSALQPSLQLGPFPMLPTTAAQLGGTVSEIAELCGAAVLWGEESRAQGCGCRWRPVGGTQQQLCATLWHNPEQCCRIQSEESKVRKHQQDKEVMHSPTQWTQRFPSSLKAH